MKTILLGILVGLAAGILAALCGVGGGIVMVPLFTIGLGLSQKTAVATSLAAIVLTAAFGTWKNHANQLVQWPLALAAGAAGALAAWVAADYLKKMSDLTLTRVFGVVLIIAGAQMLLKK